MEFGVDENSQVYKRLEEILERKQTDEKLADFEDYDIYKLGSLQIT